LIKVNGFKNIKEMELFIAAVVFLGLGIFVMNFNIIFRRNKPFPDSEVGHNKAIKKLGIRCASGAERKLWKGKNNPLNQGKQKTVYDYSACSSCDEDCALKQ